jgi:hypothetical protein
MKIAPSIKRFGFGAAAALVLTSCLSEMPRSFPTLPDIPGFVPSFVPVVTSPSLLASTRHKSNRVKYRDTGRKPTAAQSGDFTLQLRALLAKNGETTIEATTGVFEERVGVDIIDKTALRVLSLPEAEPIQAWPRAPYYRHDMRGLVPGDEVYLQASVKRKGVSRTEIFRVTDTVFRRPDLAVLELRAPVTARVGMPVSFFVSAGELNGDVSARANCSLSIDGSRVDEAVRIWVDAGDVVTCQFAYVFQMPGTFTVSASLTDVSPGDWDDANNAMSRQVTVASPGTPIGGIGALSVVEEAYVQSNSQQRTGAYPIESVNGSELAVSTIDFESRIPEIVPGLQRFDAKVSRDAEVLFDTTITDFSTFQFVSMGATVNCALFSGNEHEVRSCTRTNTDGTGSTMFEYWRTTGTVTYFGQTLWCNLGGCQTWAETRPPTSTGSGTRFGLTAGSQVRVELSFVPAAGDPRTVDRTVAMQDISGNYNQSGSFCDPFDSARLGTVCYSWETVGIVLRGEVYWP